MCEIPGFWGCCFGKGVYIRSIPLNVRFFGGGENHLKEWLVVPGFAGDYKGALFDLGVSQSHFPVK